MSTAAGRVVNSNTGCCSIPPVQSDYKPKGKFISYAGFKQVYATGLETSDTHIVAVYDVFGFKPQTQQGADMLAHAMNARVLMPDFLEPNKAWDVKKFPPKTDKEKKELQEFFAGPANPEDVAPKLLRVGKELRSDGAKFVVTYGLCWGGKVTILSGCSQDENIFDAISAIHPAMLSANDAKDLSVPLGLFISKDEPKDEYDKIVEIISEKPFADKNAYKFYPSMFHGWAGARADLDNPENRKQFDDVYNRLRHFFNGALCKED